MPLVYSLIRYCKLISLVSLVFPVDHVSVDQLLFPMKPVSCFEDFNKTYPNHCRMKLKAIQLSLEIFDVHPKLFS